MEQVQIIFEIQINGLEFPEVSFGETTPEFKNIRLNPTNINKFLYEILVKKNINVLSGDEMRSVIQEAMVEAQTFIYVFSAAADVKIYGFTCKGYREHSGCLVSLDPLLNGHLRATLQGQGTVEAGPQSIERIKQKMQKSYDLSNLRMFYDSATVTEPIGRFISLYALMLHCNGTGKQVEVDEAILKIDSTVAQSRSPIKPHSYETIFTKLRNELSHKRNGVNILETHTQIRSNVERFEQIVKAHVLGGVASIP